MTSSVEKLSADMAKDFIGGAEFDIKYLQMVHRDVF
jgi:hypothetical protein